MTNSRQFFIFFLIIFFFSNSFAQNEKIEGYKKELEEHKENDTIKVGILHDLAFEFFNVNKEKSQSYLEEARSLSIQLDFKKGIAATLHIKGMFEVRQAQYEKARTSFKKALKVFQSVGNVEGGTVCYNAIGNSYLFESKFKEALPYLKENIRQATLINNSEYLVSANLSIANAYSNLGEYPQAIKHYKDCLKISKEINNQQGVAYSINNLGLLYENQGNYPLALEYYNESLSLKRKIRDTLGIGNTLSALGNLYTLQNDYDKALQYYEESLEIDLKFDAPDKIATAKDNIGQIYKHKKEYAKALEYINAALKISLENGHSENTATSYNSLGSLYMALNEPAKARGYFLQTEDICIRNGYQASLCRVRLSIAKTLIQERKHQTALPYVLKAKTIANEIQLLDSQMEAERQLFEIYQENKAFKKALSSHKKYKTLNDSLFNKENVQKMTALEYEYKYKQELDSASLREFKLNKTIKTTSQDLEKSQQNYLLAIIGALLVAILFGSVIFYQKYRNIKAKNQNIVTEQRLLRSQMTPHFIFNSLSVLQGMILNKENKKSVSYLSKFSKLLRIILENSRDKTVLLSEELTAIENYLALHNLENEAYKHSLTVADNIDTSRLQIPPMLIQPFIENAIEHAFPNQKENKHIAIALSYNDKNLVCTIQDNGVGINAFAKTKESEKTSLATKITSERLKILSKDFKMAGKIVIEDLKDYNKQGTLVTLTIPYKIHVS